MTKIEITSLKNHEYIIDNALVETYAANTLHLVTARCVGDTEEVNNYVLGQLNHAKEIGILDFKKCRGGFREGAGRKKSVAKCVTFGATQEVLDILSKVKNKSQFNCDVIKENRGR